MKSKDRINTNQTRISLPKDVADKFEGLTLAGRSQAISTILVANFEGISPGLIQNALPLMERLLGHLQAQQDASAEVQELINILKPLTPEDK